MIFDSDAIENYWSFVATHERNEYWSKPKKLELELKHCESRLVKKSIVEAQKLGLKAIPPHMMYVFSGRDDTLLVIIAID